MARYAQRLKDQAVARLLPPESASVDTVAHELGVGIATLERWRAEALGACNGRSRHGIEALSKGRLEAGLAANRNNGPPGTGRCSWGCKTLTGAEDHKTAGHAYQPKLPPTEAAVFPAVPSVDTETPAVQLPPKRCWRLTAIAP